MWVARDKDGELFLYGTKPKRDRKEGFFWVEDLEGMFQLPKEILPAVTWQNESVEVRIGPQERCGTDILADGSKVIEVCITPRVSRLIGSTRLLCESS